jgi:UDP-N-acetylmuramoyl-tripeptide--D-alanyl-D-alanine ligase
MNCRPAGSTTGFTIDEILTATGGELVRAGAARTVRGISIDTRTMKRGELYVAIIGKSLDGHRFVAQAVKNGAPAVVVSQAVLTRQRILAKHGAAVIRVSDTTRALGDIAAFHRRRFAPHVVGITGSNGKSTTKEMLAAILGQRLRVLKPRSSFNNDIGVPLTVLELTSDTQAAVVEMEMNILGGIRRLCEIAQPQTGIITNIGDTHLEFLRDRDGVAQEKSELIEFINGNGTAVLNADDPRVAEIGRKFPTREQVWFGVEQKADIHASRVRDQGLDGVTFRLNGAADVHLSAVGAHNVTNALAAAAGAHVAGLRLADIIAGLTAYRPLPLRLEVEQFAGLRVIADCYNANPQSMSAALAILAQTGKGRRIAVLGDMLELGEAATEAHRTVGRQAGEVADLVLVKGQYCREVAAGARVAGLKAKAIICAPDSRDIVEKLVDTAQAGDTILVKGSRANRMEVIVRELKAHYGEKD